MSFWKCSEFVRSLVIAMTTAGDDASGNNFIREVVVGFSLVDRQMKTSSIAVETSRSTSQSDSIVRQTNKTFIPMLHHDEHYSHL